MKLEEIEAIVIAKLAKAAPGTDPASLDRDEPFREALDLDSLDFLRFVTSLHDALAVDVPEVDYPKILTIRACSTYLETRVSHR